MSTGLDCYFKEEKTENGFVWFMFLERDWGSRSNPDYDKYGPFKNFAAAEKELDNHANPGGYSVNAHPESNNYDLHLLAEDKVRLVELERDFDNAGGRGVWLAEEIDRTRARIARLEKRLAIA